VLKKTQLIIFESKSSRARGVSIMHSAYNSHKTLFFSDDVKTITLQNAVFKLNGMREKEKKNVILLNRFVSKWMP